MDKFNQLKHDYNQFGNQHVAFEMLHFWYEATLIQDYSFHENTKTKSEQVMKKLKNVLSGCNCRAALKVFDSPSPSIQNVRKLSFYKCTCI